MANRADAARVARRPRNATGARVAGARRGLRRPDTLAWLLPDWAPPDGPYPATEDEALGLPPFGRGVELLANGIAATPWRAMRWDPELGVAVRRPVEPAVLANPYPNTTAWSYRWAATEDGILYGNHFALYGDVMDSDTGWPAFLVPLPADEVWVASDPGNPLAYSWVVGGTTYGPAELFHVAFGSRSGELLGRGKLWQYAEALGNVRAADRHAGTYFAGGALPPAVLTSPTAVTQPQADELKSKWRAMTSTREPVVLPSGVVLTPVVTNAEQAQLVESRQWNAETVAMLLGIPSYKLGLPGPTMTYQNVESADIDFVRDSVDRYGRPLVEAMTKWLMPRGTHVEFDYASRMRADQTTTATVLRTYVDAGILTTDEARAVLGRPPVVTVEDDETTPPGVPELTPDEVS